MQNRLNSKWELKINVPKYRFSICPSNIYDAQEFISSDIKKNINEFIQYCIDSIINREKECKLEYNENDMVFYNLVINHELREQHKLNPDKCPNIRVDFYPYETGLNVVVNVKGEIVNPKLSKESLYIEQVSR